MTLMPKPFHLGLLWLGSCRRGHGPGRLAQVNFLHTTQARILPVWPDWRLRNLCVSDADVRGRRGGFTLMT